MTKPLNSSKALCFVLNVFKYHVLISQVCIAHIQETLRCAIKIYDPRADRWFNQCDVTKCGDDVIDLDVSIPEKNELVTSRTSAQHFKISEDILADTNELFLQK